MDKYNFTETDKTILKRLVDEKEEEYLSKKRAKDLFEKDILLRVYKLSISIFFKIALKQQV